jgi:hypothetical protein
MSRRVTTQLALLVTLFVAALGIGVGLTPNTASADGCEGMEVCTDWGYQCQQGCPYSGSFCCKVTPCIEPAQE